MNRRTPGRPTPPIELDLPHWQMGRYDRKRARLRHQRAQMRVLIADDHIRLATTIAEILEELGFCVVGIARNGQQAIEMTHRFQPDVVLMDLRMPEMDGIAATSTICANWPAVRVIILSAYDDPALIRDARRAGADKFLAKGVSSEEIDAALLGTRQGLG